MQKRLTETVIALKAVIRDFVPEVGIVLGSGMGGFAERLEVLHEVSYTALPAFPKATVSGHAGKFIFAKIDGIPCVIVQGRLHHYEGLSMPESVMTVRTAAMLGVKKMILTNAAGAINKDFKIGDIMVIEDHILLADNPLKGPNLDFLGPRFPDMTKPYDDAMNEILRKSAYEHGHTLQRGVYLQLQGPSYETPAEIRAFRKWGADAVGMSTAAETVALRHAGVMVAGLSLLTNMASGVTDEQLSHEEVTLIGKQAEEKMFQILTGAVARIAAL